MPRNALPKHLQDFDWKGTDNEGWLMQLKKKVQIWFAAGPNVPSGFWKWRDMPFHLLLLAGKGDTRWENTDGTRTKDGQTGFFVCSHWSKWNLRSVYYLSRIQPWCRWHISLQWPLFFNCHLIYRAKDVVKYPTYQSSFGINKMLTFGIGFKRDGDKVYWLTANLGGNFE